MSVHHFNAIYFQVRPMSDALYNSSYEPTSSYLTGSRGTAASWDPLAYAVTEAHKRGLELHAWVNPYRWAGSASVDWNTSWDKQVKTNGWILTTNKGKILNPGLQDVQDHIVKVCKEIITKYDVDGLVFDDYFYNSDTPEDATAGDYTTFKNSGTVMTIADWRRDNVNRMVKAVYNMVQENKPYIRFGISPAGVAKKGAEDAGFAPYTSTNASDWQYDGIYSDPLAWLKQGSIDYISPQLYWSTTHSTNPFGPLTRWWSRAAKYFNRHHYASHSISSLTNSSTTDDWDEIAKQIQYSRDYTQNNAPGCVMFRSGFISGPNAAGLGHYLQGSKFNMEALIPEITWKNHATYESVSDLTRSNSTLSWNGITDTPIRYTIYAIPSDISYTDAFRSDGDGICSDYLLGMTYNTNYTLPSNKISGYGYAVCIFDQYGKEYTPKTYNVTGLNSIGSDDFAMNIYGKTLHFTIGASVVKVYNLIGLCVAQYDNVSTITLDLPSGIYIIKAQSFMNSSITTKIKIR